MSKQDEAAWGDFWAANPSGGPGSGCLPAGWQGIDNAQQDCWTAFAQKIDKNVRVLDIATGDGRVMAWILAARSGVKPVGVDLAPTLPKPPAGTKVRAGIDMAKLPFKDSHFGAVVSQFGFEYGAIEDAAIEIARVLAPDGLVGLLTHRQDGAILAHNLERRAQIEWALKDRKLIDKAVGSLRLRAAGVTTIPAEIVETPAEGAAKFGEGSAAWEIPEAIRQALQLGMRDHPQNVLRLLQTIGVRAANEVGRITSLERACSVTADTPRMAAAFAGAGLSEVSRTEVMDGHSGKPFADFTILRVS